MARAVNCPHITHRRGEVHRCVLPAGHRVPLHQYGGMPRVGMRRSREEREYTRLRAAFLEGRPVCELCEEARATEVHHMCGRTGSLYLDVNLWKALCHDCHAWATEHPLEAIRVGISKRRVGGTE